MDNLKNLTELQIIKMYQKDGDQKLLDYIDNRIKDLHDNNTNPDILTNEQLVLLIQKYDSSIYWSTLYQKTKNSIHYCIRKYAASFYKSEYTNSDDKESTDLFATIRLGWYKAVRTYDITRGGAGFVAYASTIMFQHYIRLTRQQNDKHIGLSVNALYVESVHSTSTEATGNTTKSKMVENVYTDDSVQDTLVYEAKEYMKEKLEELKEFDPITYEVVMLKFYGQLSQVEIVNKLSTPEKKRNKTWVSRQIKKGKQFLKEIITDEDYLNILKDLN